MARVSGLHQQVPSSGEQIWSSVETMKHPLLFQTLKAHDLPPGIQCLPPVPSETWISIKKDAKQNTNLKRDKNKVITHKVTIDNI